VTDKPQGRIHAATPALVFAGSFLFSLWVFRPGQYYFYGDSWGCLWSLLKDWKNIFQLHGEHFMPFFKAFYLVEYKLFGSHHLPYMVVVLALHAGIATLVFLLGRRFEMSNWLSLAAAMVFAFSSVHWQVTGWSFQQTFQLSMLFSLGALYVLLPNPHEKGRVTWLIVLSVVAYWFGPLAIALPLSLSVYYLLWVHNNSQPVPNTRVLWTLAAVWLPSFVYLLSLRAVSTFTNVLAIHHSHLALHSIPSMIDFTLYGASYGLVLPTLTFANAASVSSATLILILLVLLGTVCYRALSRGRERSYFWLLVLLILSPFFAASVIRLEAFGVQGGTASRYQYFPSAPLGLLIVLCWHALAKTIVNRAGQVWFRGLGIVSLVYFLLFHIPRIRNPETNPAMAQGIRARDFLALAKRCAYLNTTPAELSVLVPEITVPEFLDAGPPTEWHPPFWMIFQVLEVNTQGFLPVADALGRLDASFHDNLVHDGGFESPDTANSWRTYGNAKFELAHRAALKGSYGVEAMLGQGSAFSQDVVRSCPKPMPRTIFTYSVQAKTDQEGSLIARLIFKDANNRILENAPSLPHPGGGQWRQLIISGLSREGTCTVGVDVVNAGPSQLATTVDEFILVAHPGTVDRSGSVVFRTLDEVLAAGEKTR
jgi:hypothetical protein